MKSIASANGSSANIKLSKTQFHRIRQSGGLGPLLKTGLSFIGNILKSLAKSVLPSLGLTAAASATDAAIHEKIFGSGVTTIWNEEINDIMKIVKCLEESALLIKGVSETVQNERKEQKWGLLGMLLGTLGPSLFGNQLTSKRTIRAGQNF